MGKSVLTVATDLEFIGVSTGKRQSSPTFLFVPFPSEELVCFGYWPYFVQYVLSAPLKKFGRLVFNSMCFNYEVLFDYYIEFMV